MQILSDYPVVDVNRAPLSAEDAEESASVTFLNLSFEDKTKIWSALNIPYQVGVYFTVSPVLLSSRRSEPFVRVTDIEVQTGQRESRAERR